MARTRERIVLLTVILTMVSLIFTAFLSVDATFAEPKQTKSSMSARVQSQREGCETLGGGEMDYVNSYENGKLVGVTTYCKGGTQDGWNCANTATTYECWQGPKSRTVQPPVLVHEQPITTVGGVDIEIDDGGEHQAQPGEGSVLENTGTGPIFTPSVDTSPMPVLVPLN